MEITIKECSDADKVCVIKVIPAWIEFGFQSFCLQTPDTAGNKTNEVTCDVFLWLWKERFYVPFGKNYQYCSHSHSHDFRNSQVMRPRMSFQTTKTRLFLIFTLAIFNPWANFSLLLLTAGNKLVEKHWIPYLFTSIKINCPKIFDPKVIPSQLLTLKLNWCFFKVTSCYHSPWTTLFCVGSIVQSEKLVKNVLLQHGGITVAQIFQKAYCF